MRGWWQDLTDLVLPTGCGGCGRPRTVLCPECRAVLNGALPRRVRPVPEPPGLPVVHAAARYADEVRAVLLAHKERGALPLATPLGTALAGAVRAGLREAWRTPWRGREGQGAGAWGDGVVMLVPVPSSRGVVRARGHDPTRRIALAAAGELRRAGTPARVVSVLRQRRAVADQAGLNSRQRLENLAGALEVVPGGGRLLCGGPVVLVDDLMTTGASLTEAARAVRVASAAPAGEPAVSGEAVSRETASGLGGPAYGGMVGDLGAVAGRGEVPRRHLRAGGVDVGVNAADVYGRAATAVYGETGREGRGVRTGGMTEEEAGRVATPSGRAGARRCHDLICAAVIAATPDSFEINRN